MTTHHKTINPSDLPFRFTGPDRSAQIEAAIREERAVLASARDGSATAMVAGRNVDTLKTALEQSRRNDQARAAWQARIDAEKAGERASLEDQRAAEEVELKARLRGRYMSLPGATEEAFERDYPELLRDHRRQQLARPAVNKSRYVI